MNFIHTGVPLLYANEGICTPNFTLITRHNDRNSYQSINSYTAIDCYSSGNSFEVKAYIEPNTGDTSIHNSSVINGGGAA